MKKWHGHSAIRRHLVQCCSKWAAIGAFKECEHEKKAIAALGKALEVYGAAQPDNASDSD